MKHKRGFAVILLPIIIGGILIVGYVFFIRYFSTPFEYEGHLLQIPPLITDIPLSVTPYPVDTVNDGVYRNDTYKFTFRYPEDVFVYQSSYQRTSAYWANEPDAGTIYMLTKDGMWMSVIVGAEYTSSYDQDFEQVYSLVGSKTVEKDTKTLISKSNLDGERKIYIFHKTPKDVESR